jgi:hypothetical protein
MNEMVPELCGPLIEFDIFEGLLNVTICEIYLFLFVIVQEIVFLFGLIFLFGLLLFDSGPEFSHALDSCQKPVLFVDFFLFKIFG